MKNIRLLLISLTHAAQAFGQTVSLPQQFTVLIGSGSVEAEGLRVMLNAGRITLETEVMAQGAASPIKIAAILDQT